jgi:SAM-dependent methyltransferase
MTKKFDEFYVGLEQKFRGDDWLIKDRQKVYLPIIRKAMALCAGADRPVLDIGCGRGEWLRLLQENHVPAYGLDMNAEMVKRCNESGVSAVHDDAIRHMKSLSDKCLLAVTGFHIVEHLETGIALEILTEIERCLVDGGVLIFETPNPENILVSCNTFYIDPTHTKPIPPLLLDYMFEFSGLRFNHLMRLHPRLDAPVINARTEEIAYVLEKLEGPQDYAIISVKGASGDGELNEYVSTYVESVLPPSPMPPQPSPKTWKEKMADWLISK